MSSNFSDDHEGLLDIISQLAFSAWSKNLLQDHSPHPHMPNFETSPEIGIGIGALPLRDVMALRERLMEQGRCSDDATDALLCADGRRFSKYALKFFFDHSEGQYSDLFRDRLACREEFDLGLLDVSSLNSDNNPAMLKYFLISSAVSPEVKNAIVSASEKAKKAKEDDVTYDFG
jgi:hypothetical protein